MLIRILSLVTITLSTFPAFATFSIVACNPDGTCGAGVATHNLAVGATVIHAQSGVGALATQFETNPRYGARGIGSMAAGMTPAEALNELILTDGNFEGTSVEYRQVGIVNVRGDAATFTGDEALKARWSGSIEGRGYAIQGNGLASERVGRAMERAYLATSGSLASRLMAALSAAHAAGGQTIGEMSAALLIRTPEGDWQDIDLRVDGSDSPIADLQRLLNQHTAHQAMLRAERAARSGNLKAAHASLAEALHLGHSWDRIWRRAARLSISVGDKQAAVSQFGVFAAMNPTWARADVDDAIFSEIRNMLLSLMPKEDGDPP